MAKKKYRRKRAEGLRLTDKKHPTSAIFATVLGFLSIIVFVIVCVLSGQTHGNSGVGIGVTGLLCFIMSILGFSIACLSLREDNIRPLFPTLSAMINGFMLVFYLIVYILGTA